MAIKSLMPCFGIDNVSEDAAMVQGGKEPFVFVRDAVNVNVTPAGMIEMIASGGKVTDNRYQCLWQSPLHKDVFAVLDDEWVKVDISDWSNEPLASIGSGDVWHTVLNNLVVVAGKLGLFYFDGKDCLPLTIDTPPMPVAYGGIDKTKQTRSIAISYVRGDKESALSDYVTSGASTKVIFPMIFDRSITGVNVYATNVGGTDMQLAGRASVSDTSFEITEDHKLGMSAQFAHLSPMPTGKYLCYWRGRLITATANVIRFSEPLAYHLHDERHGFIQTSQGITFIQPVEGGLWVGQFDHVLFIQGSQPDEMTVSIKAAANPVPGSAIQIDAELIGEASEGGAQSALWLSSNGYVIGTSSGQVVELNAGRIKNISAQSATTVRLARRLLTSVE